jgi:arsenite-transporting ATPase
VLTFLTDRHLRLLFFGGKGGVGKTTCAAAAALHLARRYPEDSFLLVSTDPAHSLRDSLEGAATPPNLTVVELNAKKCLTAFLGEHRLHLQEIARRGTFLDDQDIHGFLDLSLPGLDELLGLLEICRRVEAREYGSILVDTAPTGHALRLLAMPELIRQWLAALDAMLAKHRFLKRRFGGSCPADELDKFLADFAAAINRLEALLRDPHHCRFIPVTLAAGVVLQETAALLRQLQRRQMPVREILVNRFYPPGDCPVCAGERQRQLALLPSFRKGFPGYRLWGIPLYPQEMRGNRLLDFWEGAAELSSGPASPRPVSAPGPWQVERPSQDLSPQLRLRIFAGKGGVGKTTLACATALRLSRDFPGKKVLLISTDPAHSLTACLETPIGPKPVRVLPGLTALEIDAASEFASFKKQFRQELEGIWDSPHHQLSLPFDRGVMERLLDLAPPGLDEIMALTRIIEFLAQGQYDLLVLDTAPTGHLLRLLELPELMAQWLKGLFGLFLKYRLSAQLPKLSHQLVKISQGLKYLRSLWRDPQRSALMLVAVPTKLALEETRDLWRACHRLGLSVRGGFLNLLTADSRQCPRCAAWNRHESRIVARFRQMFHPMQLTLIYRHPEPRGIAALTALGQALYRAPAPRSLAYLQPRGGKFMGKIFLTGRRHVPIPG